MTYLLDVNVLLALADSMHLHHEAAHHWFAITGSPAWSTCPMTENGFVRVASHTSYPNRPGDVVVVLNILRQFCTHPGHNFWPDIASLHDLSPLALFSHHHLTDVYLLSLAVQYGGKLATFDHHIPSAALKDGSAAVEIIAS